MNKQKIAIPLFVLVLAMFVGFSMLNDFTITGNVVREQKDGPDAYQYVKSINELNSLSEGKYVIKNWQVYYDDSGTLAPIYVIIENDAFRNGILEVSSDGYFRFEVGDDNDALKDNVQSSNAITGAVSGMEGVSGLGVFDGRVRVYDKKTNKAYNVVRPITTKPYLTDGINPPIKNPDPNNYNAQKAPVFILASGYTRILQVEDKVTRKESCNSFVTNELKRRDDRSLVLEGPDGKYFSFPSNDQAFVLTQWINIPKGQPVETWVPSLLSPGFTELEFGGYKFVSNAAANLNLETKDKPTPEQKAVIDNLQTKSNGYILSYNPDGTIDYQNNKEKYTILKDGRFGIYESGDVDIKLYKLEKGVKVLIQNPAEAKSSPTPSTAESKIVDGKYVEVSESTLNTCRAMLGSGSGGAGEDICPTILINNEKKIAVALTNSVWLDVLEKEDILASCEKSIGRNKNCEQMVTELTTATQRSYGAISVQGPSQLISPLNLREGMSIGKYQVVSSQLDEMDNTYTVTVKDSKGNEKIFSGIKQSQDFGQVLFTEDQKVLVQKISSANANDIYADDGYYGLYQVNSVYYLKDKETGYIYELFGTADPKDGSIYSEDKTIRAKAGVTLEVSFSPPSTGPTTLPKIDTLGYEDIEAAAFGKQYAEFAKGDRKYYPINDGIYSTLKKSDGTTLVELKNDKGELLNRLTIPTSLASRIDFDALKKNPADSKGIPLQGGTYLKGGESGYYETKYQTFYVQDGKMISSEDYGKLSNEEKERIGRSAYTVPTSMTGTETKEKNSQEFILKFNTELSKDGKFITTYSGFTIDKSTGKQVGFVYGSGDNPADPASRVTLTKENGLNFWDVFSGSSSFKCSSDDKTKCDQAVSELRPKLSAQFFANAEKILTEYQGLAYIPTLFMSDDSLLKWRDSVDRIFATFYLGTEYWSSKICGQYIDGESEGIAFAETPQGLAQVGAHIEATRTPPIYNGETYEYIYKITFAVRNGDYEKDPRAPSTMHVNVVLKGSSTATVFKKEIEIKRGSQVKRSGTSAIVKDSKNFYSEVCLTFDEVPLRWKISGDELCNTIVESGSAPSVVGGTSPSSPQPSGSGGELNDF